MKEIQNSYYYLYFILQPLKYFYHCKIQNSIYPAQNQSGAVVYSTLSMVTLLKWLQNPPSIFQQNKKQPGPKDTKDLLRIFLGETLSPGESVHQGRCTRGILFQLYLSIYFRNQLTGVNTQTLTSLSTNTPDKPSHQG